MGTEDLRHHEGSCACGEVRYQMVGEPMFVNCCHCRWCQRETGAAFALNAIIEASRVELLCGKPEAIDTPSESGRGQIYMRCPSCKVALWSHYAGSGNSICYVRVGNLVEPDRVPPRAHIFTSTKQPWVTLSGDIPIFPEAFVREDIWPADSSARRQAALKE